MIISIYNYIYPSIYPSIHPAIRPSIYIYILYQIIYIHKICARIDIIQILIGMIIGEYFSKSGMTQYVAFE